MLITATTEPRLTITELKALQILDDESILVRTTATPSRSERPLAQTTPATAFRRLFKLGRSVRARFPALSRFQRGRSWFPVPGLPGARCRRR